MKNSNQYNDKNLDEFDLIDLFKLFWSGKLIIFYFSSAFSIAFILYSFFLPKYYVASALLAPVNEEQVSSSALSSLESITASFGLPIGKNSSSRFDESIKILTSYHFFEQSFLPRIKLEDLLAVKSWNSDTNTLIYNSKIFNFQKNSWIKNNKFLSNFSPSSQEAYKFFHKELFSITVDKQTSFVTLQIKHQSPYLARDWVRLSVELINEMIREQEKKRTTASIDFLNDQFLKTNIAMIKQLISSLLQKEIADLTLIESNQEYILKFLDYPVAAEKRSYPQRFKFALFGTIIGFFLGCFVIIFRRFK